MRMTGGVVSTPVRARGRGLVAVVVEVVVVVCVCGGGGEGAASDLWREGLGSFREQHPWRCTSTSTFWVVARSFASWAFRSLLSCFNIRVAICIARGRGQGKDGGAKTSSRGALHASLDYSLPTSRCGWYQYTLTEEGVRAQP
jgi:hypothetical protein